MRLPDSPEQDAVAAEQEQAKFARFALENPFDVSPDAIPVTNSDGEIRGVSPCAAELFGHPQTELMDRPIENLVPERFLSRHANHRENDNEHPHARQAGAAMSPF